MSIFVTVLLVNFYKILPPLLFNRNFVHFVQRCDDAQEDDGRVGCYHQHHASVDELVMRPRNTTKNNIVTCPLAASLKETAFLLDYCNNNFCFWTCSLEDLSSESKFLKT